MPRRAYKILEAVTTQLAMIAVVGPFFFIFFYMFWNSLKPDYLFFEPGVWRFEPVWENYTAVFENSDLVRNIGNSVVISGFATIIGLACGLLTAYTVARFNLRKLAMAILLTRMIPYITALVPFWIVYKHAGLLNTYTGLVLSHLVITIPFGVWIMMGFIEDIPRELEEAAWIDGASRTKAFFKVVLPLSTPGLVATAILCFIFSWNNFQFALVLGGFDVSTAPVSVFKYADPEAGGSGQMMAAATLVTIPVFIIVLAIQKQMAAGLTMGGVKQ
ncbi:MAG: carbohydrate ABC transporter permease [Ectothiorhodospiraceae bacterium]|nr:carbohydrate ABC transporter permease [Chromatiales bacterium]MCP5156395.1 carbohydrate ABC transporter permease [Ectothiorhodospiraceae bacterium]